MLLAFGSLLCIKPALLFAQNMQTYTPKSESTVLALTKSEYIGAKISKPLNREERLSKARYYVIKGKKTATPRDFAYAEQLLSPWWDSEDNIDSEFLTIKADILQSRHQFKFAVQELKRALKINPNQIHTWLQLANIEKIQGDFISAQNSCNKISQLSALEISIPCMANIVRDKLQLEKYYKLLATMVEVTEFDASGNIQLSAGANTQQTDLKQWQLLILAELADRLGYSQKSDYFFRKAIELKKNTSAIKAYADSLIFHKRWDTLVHLLENQSSENSHLMLQLSLAEKSLGYRSYQSRLALIGKQFTEYQQRKESPQHLESFAFYCLAFPFFSREVLNEKCDYYLSENWKVQKSFFDAYLLARANYSKYGPQIEKWFNRQGIYDHRRSSLKLSSGSMFSSGSEKQ